jgi:glycosyltransferase involved in cell wall biosynthesis
MHVCFLAPEFYPIWGGGGAYAMALVQNLPKDVKVTVLATRRKVPEAAKDSSQELPQNMLSRDISVRYLSSGDDTFFSHAKFQYACYKWVQKLNKEYRFDVIHSQHQPMSDILLKLMSKKMHFITTVHETFSRRNNAIRDSKIGFTGYEGSEKWMVSLSPFLQKTEQLYMKKSKAFISPSNWMKNVLCEDFKIDESNIRVVYNAVDHRKFCPSAKRSEFIQKIYDAASGPIVLFSGRMISTKGVHVLIRAIPKVLREIKDAHFVFTGGGNSRPYKQMIDKMGIPVRNYNFVGYVPDFDDLPGLYSIASVYVAPTLYENFPFRVLENMSCQNPVIATRIVGIPEMITDGVDGLLVSPSDSEVLAEFIVRLVSDRVLAKRLGQNARKTIEERFTFREFADKTKEAYDWVAAT